MRRLAQFRELGGPAPAGCKAPVWSIVVLYEINKAVTRHLGRLLDDALESSIRFRQDFPPDLVPIRAADVVRPLDRYVCDVA